MSVRARRSLKGTRVYQGDILRRVEFIEYAIEKNATIEVSKIVFPLVVVLTQDCDLEQDANNRRSYQRQQTEFQDKWLFSVLVAPIYNMEHAMEGSHLGDLSMTMRPLPGSSQLKSIKDNERPRYHYFEFEDRVGIPPSIVDFKHYFSVNVAFLRSVKSKNYVCTLSPLFREDLSQRFASYLARIGLPESHRPKSP